LYVPEVEPGFCRYLSILSSLWEGLHRARGDELNSAECWTFRGKEKEERKTGRQGLSSSILAMLNQGNKLPWFVRGCESPAGTLDTPAQGTLAARHSPGMC
jgi:hypothetical protein